MVEQEQSRSTAKLKAYTRYPWSSVFVYNGATVAHYVLGAIGISLGYSFSGIGYLLGVLYLMFAFLQMYVVMPLTVCPNCAYVRMKNSLCVTGLNVVSKRVAKEGDRANFSNRAKGAFCPNNLYLGALVIPIILMIPALVANFSVAVLILWLVVIGLLLFRFFVVFRRTACIHCAAKYECPNAQSMGIV